MKDYIVVVGGYGHVGQSISRQLGECFPGKVYAAGRNLSRAQQFSRSTNGKVLPLQLNIAGGFDRTLRDRVKLVVMCLDQTDTSFVRFCFENGIDYVDVSANHSFLAQVEQLQAEAKANEATAILSIGLAPGLTNLMAYHAKSLMDHTDALDISIMLGMGDHHGKAAIEWTIDNLGNDFEVVRGDKKVAVASFADGKKTNFGGPLGSRKAYRFNFSDQHVLPLTLGVPTVSTRLCFDSVAITGLLAGLKASGMFRLLRYKPVRSAAVQLFGRMKFGTEIFAVKIDAWGKRDHEHVKVESFLQGTSEAEITAKVAAFVAERAYRAELPHGVYHIEQLFELNPILASMDRSTMFETRTFHLQ
ncbi:saccharopine dehydrogenase family protein [Cohnella herbarum]|uniref:Saccharopine dehydrogenase n=1 Tax=Cohnella herbarum TaxID=2728023 RepID=A0A7Z2VSC6_9BACL|nr:saccharopine dehydrogenase [Cohnella herbarum]